MDELNSWASPKQMAQAVQACCTGNKNAETSICEVVVQSLHINPGRPLLQVGMPARYAEKLRRSAVTRNLILPRSERGDVALQG